MNFKCHFKNLVTEFLKVLFSFCSLVVIFAHNYLLSVSKLCCTVKERNEITELGWRRECRPNMAAVRGQKIMLFTLFKVPKFAETGGAAVVQYVTQ
jgi:hypothetical protein